MLLSMYLNDTAALMNDSSFTFTSKPQMIRWINEARTECARRTGCVRRLITGQSAFGASTQPGFLIPGGAQPGSLPGAFPQSSSTTGLTSDFNNNFSADFTSTNTTSLGVVGAVQNPMMTIPGVERYPYAGFFNPQLRAQHAGTDRVMDTIACSVNWGGASRPTLDWMPWDDLQAYARAYAVLNESYPSVWSVYNDGPQGEIWMFPVPSQVGEIELDVFASPANLNTDSDYDVIPEGFSDAIKFGAAKLCYMSSNRFAQAQMMEDTFADSMGVARVSADRGKAPSYYFRNV